jgi:hypothetical protein
MVDDSRLDGKLEELSRELMARSMVPGFTIADAFTTQGLDETGRLGLFAAILLAPTPAPELNTLTAFRQVLTARLKQLDTRTPAFPIVVQGAPEIIDASSVVPGGREYFEQVKLELRARRDRLRPVRRAVELPPAPPAARAPVKAKKVRAARAVVSARTARRPARRATSRAASKR